MSTGKTVRIGTRRSRLARVQTRLVADMLGRAFPSWETTVVTFDTAGDRRAGPLATAGGKGLFTAELESALRDGRVDIAVHSAKDMPAVMDDGLVIAAVPPRGDPADVIVSRYGTLEAIPPGARVGTGSPRRAVQLRALRGDLAITGIRGNIETRIDKALGPRPELDGVVLAAAGLHRAGMFAAHRDAVCPLDTAAVLPAAGQGTLAIQAAAANTGLVDSLGAVHHADSGAALDAERCVVAALGADCGSSLAVYVRRETGGAGRWVASAMVSRPDGSGMLRREAEGTTARESAARLLACLIDAGAKNLV